jgi:cobyric acid synthase CobQ/L-threonine-O-3-phosphate decarboxylase
MDVTGGAVTIGATWPHGGNLRQLAEAAGLAEDEILDFSANINPLGAPDWLRPLISANVSRLCHYPDPACTKLIEAAATHYGVEADTLLVGNGSSELLYSVLPLLDASRAVIPVPSYHDYAAAAERAGLVVHPVAQDLASLARGLDQDSVPTVVILGRPNNPTGQSLDTRQLRQLIVERPHIAFLIDEAFADFVEPRERFIDSRPPNVTVLLSVTKSFAIPGLRLGLMAAESSLVQRLREALPPWSVNTLAQAVGEAAFRDTEYLERTRRTVRLWREQLAAGLDAIPGIHVYPGEANFLLARMERDGQDARELAVRLLRQGIAIRVCDNFAGLDAQHFRVAVRTEEENRRLLAAVGTELSGAPAIKRERRTPALMFQGTCSNAGKSVLTAAFCRVLLQDGFRVAPFKAQNMSLNSYVTRDGLEMGRAQVVQAQACRLDPDVRMNPVLLKPNTDTGSQIILRGRPVGNMDAVDYFQHKARAWEVVKECYDSLAAEADAVVLEGAGSPAEVNLKRHDIVNMAMAFHAAAPVVLIGDIDRGGVFAALVGCMEVFTERERAQVAGFLLNRFRGRKELLGDAADYVLRHTGRPVLGVVPFLRDLGLPEEDSVGFKEGVFDDDTATGDRVDIALIDLPHLSNFTDFDALRIEPDVHLRRVDSVTALGTPDVVILPGSKNVPGDLRFLEERGLAAAICALAQAQASRIVGICGGFQMLGQRVEDPYHLESNGQPTGGLGLLPLVTTLEREKTLRRVEGRHLESGHTVAGYEIHHGQTAGSEVPPVVRDAQGELTGGCSADGRIWGTYWHGIFDQDEFRRWFIDQSRAPRLKPIGRVLAHYDLEPALDRLAATLREALPIEELYRKMRLR